MLEDVEGGFVFAAAAAKTVIAYKNAHADSVALACLSRLRNIFNVRQLVVREVQRAGVVSVLEWWCVKFSVLEW